MLKNSADKLNKVIWNTNNKEDLVESYFLKLNFPEAKVALFIKFTFLSSNEEKSGSVWFIFFDIENSENNIAIKQTFTGNEIKISDNTFSIQMGINELKSGFTQGEIKTDRHTISWDLFFNARGEVSLIHFPYNFMYKGNFPRNKITSPIVNTKFYGEFTINEKKFKLQGEKGMQGHNYGKSHSNNWIWTHCNNFINYEEDVFIECISSKLNIGSLNTPPLTIIYFRYGNFEIFLNSPFDFVKNTSYLNNLQWNFKGSTNKYTIEGNFKAVENNFIGLTYKNPDKSSVICLNSMVANCEITLQKNYGNKEVKIFKAINTAALEIGTKNNSKQIRVLC